MFRLSVAILGITTFSGCGGGSPTSPSPPTNTTETFNGSNSLATHFGDIKHAFNVSRAGDYAVTLTKVTPLTPGVTVSVYYCGGSDDDRPAH